MHRFGWLHLTDWHFGMQGHKHLWPNIREEFLRDLELLHKKCGPWHAVFFTGDFVQRGTAEEFHGVDEMLEQLWQRLGDLGPQPVLIAVPGNHDLSRPEPSLPETLLLTRWGEFPDFHEEFWTDPKSRYRELVKKAFSAYEDWWNKCPFRGSLDIQPGILPGEFSTTWEDSGLKIGVAGLNTAFLQLTAGDFQGKLAMDSRQFHQACGGDGPAWINQHHCCIMLTHHGPGWLDEPSRKREYPQINPAGRFAVHLCGHMHENVQCGTSMGGGATLRNWQGHSLFGLEHYGEQDAEDRRHGYSAGQIEVSERGGSIRHWPRVAGYHGQNGWRIVPDYRTAILEDDQGTRPDPIDVRLAVQPCPEPPSPSELSETVVETTTVATQQNESEALAIWKEKLDFFHRELAITSDPSQKFNLRKLIEEGERMIRDLDG